MEKLLDNEFYLCYVDTEKLFQLIGENKLVEKDFQKEKDQWAKIINREPNFFSNTELLLLYHDIILLKVFGDDQLSFLVKNYQLEYQKTCQKLFHESKNIIIISDKQWKEQKAEEKLVILLKDKELIEKSLTNWLEKFAGKN